MNDLGYTILKNGRPAGVAVLLTETHRWVYRGEDQELAMVFRHGFIAEFEGERRAGTNGLSVRCPPTGLVLPHHAERWGVLFPLWLKENGYTTG